MASAYPNMSVPGASSLMSAPSLADQVAGETNEQRRKRLLAMKNGQSQSGASDLMGSSYGAALPPG